MQSIKINANVKKAREADPIFKIWWEYSSAVGNNNRCQALSGMPEESETTKGGSENFD